MMKHLEEVRGVMIPCIDIWMDSWWRAAELLELIKISPETERMVSQVTPSEVQWELGTPFNLVLEDRVYRIFFKKEDKHD